MKRISLLVTLCLAACGGEEQPAAEELAEAAARLTNPVAGGTVRATDAVNLRTGPSTANTVIRVIAAGDTATLVSATASNGFFQVRHRGTLGWSHGSWLEMVPAGGALVVNGFTLTANEDANVRRIAANVVPRLTGTRADQVRVASRVTWWSLKEGVLGLANPIGYSNCNTPSGDRRIGPLEVCSPGRAWQVGASAVQVPGRTLASLEATARQLHPGLGVYDVLWRTAVDAGYANGTSTHAGIVSSTGDLRRSWLLRNGAVGFTYEEPTVTAECINASYAWCYGTAWDTTARYAPNRAAALRSIQDLAAIFERLVP
ncbi:MAG: SH3 domain-containing protein [Myxococcaceae bacterium]|nr:SH3 domain-containing protein [Myxococcaceae bacterium]